MNRLTRRLGRNIAASAQKHSKRIGRRAKTWLGISELERREVPATFFVNNFSDGPVAAGGDLPGSLRQAIFDANANGNGVTDVIDFTGLPGSGTIFLTSGEMAIKTSTTLNGPGANKLTIDAQSLSRHFNISDDTAVQISVTVNGMTLTGGLPQVPMPNPNNASGSGGSIFVRNEKLTLDGMILTNNKVPDFYHGGAIAIGAAPIPSSSVQISLGGSLTINNSAIVNNAAKFGDGGGIYTYFPNGSDTFNGIATGFGNQLNITNSTIANNLAGQRGGGVLFSAGVLGSSSFLIRNSTVSQNKANNNSGGGLFVGTSNTTSPLSILNSTITGNTAKSNPGGAGLAFGAFPYPGPGTATITLESAIVSDNIGPASAPDIYGSFDGKVAIKNSVYGSNSGFGIIDDGGNTIGSAMLAPLANNGGIGMTHLPIAGSPAIDKGSNPAPALTLDQRGGTRVLNGTVDVGAVEFNPAAPAALAAAAKITMAGSGAATITVTYTSSVGINVGTLGAGDIRVTGPNSFDEAANYIGEVHGADTKLVTATYHLPAPIGGWTAAFNGQYSVVLQAGQVADLSATSISTDVIGLFRVAIAQNFVVTSNGDFGTGSLRDAIEQANASADTVDSITFDTVQMGSNTIPLNSEIAVMDPLVINTAGGPVVTLDGQNSTRMFVVSGDGTLDVTMSRMIMTKGLGANVGGAIALDNENLTLIDCTFTANKADGLFFGPGAGGAIGGVGIGGGSLTLLRCNFDSNTTEGAYGSDGGAIFLGGNANSVGALYDVVITDCSFTNNIGWVEGGAIAMGSGSLNISSSTFANNTANGSGGAISINGKINSNGFSIHNSTISGNIAFGKGGGLSLGMFGYYQVFKITNSTIVNNQAKGGAGGGISGAGYIGDYNLVLDSTIISSNTANSGRNLSLANKAVANNCFIGIYEASKGAVVGVNNQLGSKSAPLNALLSPLANNGGLTSTHRPYAGSPVVNAAPTTATITTLTGAGIPDAFATSFDVASTANLVPGMWIQIDAEIMRITEIFGNTVSVGGFFSSFRGMNGTTAVAHSAGAIVSNPYMVISTNDQRGAGYPRIVGSGIDIGSIEIDGNTPAANLTFAPLVTVPSQSPYQFKVTYSDNTAINVNTITTNPNNIIRVIGPNSFNQLAQLISVVPASNGSPLVATYQIVAPGGMWDGFTQDGTYTVSIEPNTVADTAGNFVEAHALGTFRVAIPLNLVVTNDNDSGAGSLRAAIEAANNNADASDTITFSSFFSTPRTITLNLGELYISDVLTIVGPGSNFATLQGVKSRIFTIDTPDYGIPISISGLTMTGGNGDSTISFSGFPVTGGGAIFNLDEALTIDGCVITKNTAENTSNDYGGGILVDSGLGSLTLTNSTVSNNTASISGGGISVQNGSVVIIQNCTFSNNRAVSSGGGINIANSNPNVGGGGVAQVSISNSTFNNNEAYDGAGIYMSGGNGAKLVTRLNITNSTLSGNVAIGRGGALAFSNYTSLLVQNTTITGNAARTSGGGVSGPSYVASYSGGMDAVVINSIIAGNKNRFTPDIAFGGSSTIPLQIINSFIGAVDPSLTKITATSSHVGTMASPLDPLVGPLLNNGGPTATHTSSSSLIINQGTANPIVNLTTLTTGVAIGETTIEVASSRSIGVGSVIRIDAEIMVVTNVSGTTITVLRGQQSTAEASHTNGAAVQRVIPALPANDQRGAGFPRQIGTVDIGSVELDTSKPVASGQFSPVTASGAGSHTITITFSDDIGLNVSTIKNNNNAIRVTGPNGFNVLATYVSLNNDVANGTPRIATYQFTTPVNGAAGWDYTDNGYYTVSIEPGQIADTNGNFIAATTINTFPVAIGRSLVVTNDSDQGAGSLRQAILDSNANLGTDTITFSGFFSTAKTIPVGSLGQMFITDPVSIVGPGASLAKIDGANQHRIFNIDLPVWAWGGAVTMSGLTLFQGVGIDVNSNEGPGGAIHNINAALVMTNCDFSENGNLSWNGGVFSLGSIYAPLTLTNCNFDQNGAYSGAVADVSGGIFSIRDSLVVTVNNCTFTNNTGGGGFGSSGVFNVTSGGTINVSESKFTTNSTGTNNGSGGAIQLGANSTANVSDSTFDGNSAGGFGNGGAINVGDSSAIANIQRSTFKNNQAGDSVLGSTFGGNGGAIAVAGKLNLDSSTISGNTSHALGTYGPGGGGAIFMSGSAQVTIANSTISGNSSKSHGGGILINYLSNDPNPTLSGSLVVRNATIAYNSAVVDGGGIHFATSSDGTPSVTLTSTIVAENTSPGADDLKSGTGNATTTFTINSSFIGDPTGAVIVGSGNKNTAMNGSVNLNPTLALNGAPAGSPLTHAFNGVSAAIDNGTNPAGLGFDQRGTGFSRTVNNKTDMGAFEVQNATPLPTVTSIKVNDGLSNQRSIVTSMTITFSEAVTFPNGIPAAFTLTRTTAPTGGPLGTVNVTGSMSGNVLTLTFLNGGDVTLDPGSSLPDGKYTLNILSNQVAGVGGFLDGTMNNVYQGSPIDDVSSNFFRLYGDGDGDGVVTSNDFSLFRQTYGTNLNPAFDFDNDGQVDSDDFSQFRRRFGLSI